MYKQTTDKGINKGSQKVAMNSMEQNNKKYHKTPTGWEDEVKKEPVNYDVKVSASELLKMFELLSVKFENHIELAIRENKVSSSLNGIHQQFLKLHKSIEKLYE